MSRYRKGCKMHLRLVAECPGRQHRTDSLSAAYRNAGSHHQQLTQLYEDLCQPLSVGAHPQQSGGLPTRMGR